MGRQCQQTLLPFRIPYLDGAVPRRRGKGCLGGEIPATREGFSRVFLEFRDGELGGQRCVIKAQGAVAGGSKEMG